MMKTIRMGAVGCGAVIAALSLSSLQAQAVQASLAKEAGTLSDKFIGLARVMAGKYDWKPGEGVFDSTLKRNSFPVGRILGGSVLTTLPSR